VIRGGRLANHRNPKKSKSEELRVKILRLALLAPLAAAPLSGQTQIGGGTCNSSSLNGTYSMTLAGRQLSSPAAFANVLQANGTAAFDGQSKVTMQLTVNTLKGIAASLTYSGTYSIQANCAGAITLTSGDTAALNLEVYNQGNAFLLTGADAVYALTGGGSTQPASGCTAAKLAGVYSVNGTGYGLSASAVNGIDDLSGLVSFDGAGKAALSGSLATVGASPTNMNLTGTYTVAANCVANASLTDSTGNTYSMAIAITGASALAVTGFDVLLGQASKFTVTGAGHPLFGQPAAPATHAGVNAQSPSRLLKLDIGGGRA
jgi:hypothetical protein